MLAGHDRTTAGSTKDTQGGTVTKPETHLWFNPGGEGEEYSVDRKACLGDTVFLGDEAIH